MRICQQQKEVTLLQANTKIREAAKRHGVRLWQIAEIYGYNDGNFSRKLRRELPEEEQRRIIGIIENLAQQAKGEM